MSKIILKMYTLNSEYLNNILQFFGFGILDHSFAFLFTSHSLYFLPTLIREEIDRNM